MTTLNRNFWLLCAFYALQAVIFFILFYKSQWFNIQSLLNWDAQHYFRITKEGYDQTRTAFFPLFPLIWKFSGLNPVGISFLNALIFIGSFAWLAQLYQLKTQHLLLIAAVPSFIFFFVPYTESIFFASSVILITGYKKLDYRLVFIGLLMASFSRPAASVFIPAIILVEWLTRENSTKAFSNISLSVIAVLIGMLGAFAVHYNYTGNWFGFFDVQANVWDNRLQIPSLPLRSWAGLKITILDGTALFISLLCSWKLLQWLWPNFKTFKIHQDKALLFSFFYLTGIGLLVLLYRNGSLFSLNRFIFTTAFFVIAAIYFTKQKFTSKWLWWIFGLLLWWLLFNSFVHIATFGKYLIATFFLCLSVLAFHQKGSISRFAFPLFFVGLALLQLYFIFRFMSNNWVG